MRVRVTRVSAGTRGGGEVGWSCTPPCLPCLRAPARTRASIPPQNPRVPPSSPAPTARPPAEFTPARKTQGERPELRPRGPGGRRGAAASHPGCSPHLANGVFRTVFPRQCPLGGGSHTEGAQRSVSVTQGPPGCSRGGQGDTPLPQSQTARRGAGVLPPHPKLGAGNPKTGQRRNSLWEQEIPSPSVGGSPPQGTQRPKGETGERRALPAPVGVSFPHVR